MPPGPGGASPSLQEPAIHRPASARPPHRRLRAGAVAAVLAVAVASVPLSSLVPSEPVALPAPPQTSALLDAGGAVLTELHSHEDRELVPLDHMPQVLQQAVVAVEDRRFFAHQGIDGRAVVRALGVNTRARRVAQGGSTITQQLAKNAVTGDDRTLARKLREAAVALRLERQMSKEAILERYLNTVYLGNGVYGVQTAARHYFGVDVEDVSLPQAALLAALLKGPATYDPRSAPAAARRRRDLVLDLMAAQHLVPAAQAAAAQRTELAVRPVAEEPPAAPDFTAHVLRTLRTDPAFAVLGSTPQEREDRLARGGLRVETTLDPTWQRAAEDAVALVRRTDPDLGAALVAIDPATGAIRAMAGEGGRNGTTPAGFTLATQARRQPGSTFKPLLLAAALARGHALDEVVSAPATVTIPSAVPGEAAWVVGNHDGAAYGDLTLRAATAMSANVVFADLTQEIGPHAVAALAQAAGVRRHLPAVQSIALGTVEVSPLELASVQATLAAGGVYRRPAAVLRIRDADGEILWERPPDGGERVMDAGVAWLVTDALGDVVRYGTGVRADLGRPMAGKTGTSQESADAWFAGYTPDLAAAVWVGFPDARDPMLPPHTPVAVEGGTVPADVFARFGAAALVDLPPRPFPVPRSSLAFVEVDTLRRCVAGPRTPPEVVAEQAYLPGTEPSAPCPS